MTQSITRETREHAQRLPDTEAVVKDDVPLFTAVGCFTAVAGSAGVACGVATLAGASWRVALMGATLLMLAGMGGVVLCLRAMITGRQEFYRRGQLEGWMRGWRGLEPEINDPLLR